MTEDGVGSVEGEARLLAETLGRMRDTHRAGDARSADPEETPHLRLVDGGDVCPTCGRPDAGDAEGDRSMGAVGDGPEGEAHGHAGRQYRADHDESSCPACQGAAWVRQYGPETLRGLADAVGLLADGIRVLAAHLERPAPTPAGRPCAEDEEPPEDVPFGPSPGRTDGTVPAPQERAGDRQEWA